MDFNDPKEFDDPQVFYDPEGISIGSTDFDNPKIYGDTFIFDGLVFFYNCILLKEHHHIHLIWTFPLRSYPDRQIFAIYEQLLMLYWLF